MSESCSGSCGSCSSDCDSRQPSREELLEPANRYSHVKKVIGVVSGKGGVGKSFVTSYLSVLLKKKGYETAILDADITGPSIPKAFNIHQKVSANELGIFPGCSEDGMKVMSVNLLLNSEDSPVIWRGPIIAGTVKQFWTEVVWGDVDYMFVDMPPGTGDVPLTVFQSIPLDGIIIVTSPQELVSMIVSKAVKMAQAMEIPILGLIENYSYMECGKCGEKMSVFGESHVEEIASKYQVPVLAKLPLDSKIAKAMDAGMIEKLEGNWLDDAVSYIEKICDITKDSTEKKEDRNKKIAITTDEKGDVYGHFGTCPSFTIYELEGAMLKEKTKLETNGSGHSEIANLLIENQVDVLICGGIGSAAMNILLEAGILCIPGQQGDVDVVVASYMDGSIMTSEAPTCAGHQEGEECSCGGSCSCH